MCVCVCVFAEVEGWGVGHEINMKALGMTTLNSYEKSVVWLAYQNLHKQMHLCISSVGPYSYFN